MSERAHVVLIGALLCAPLLGAPRTAGAQTVEEWRTRARIADSITAAASKRVRELGERRIFTADREIRAGGRRFRYHAEELSSRDSAALALGLERGRDLLRTRHGDAGVALIDPSPWSVATRRSGISAILVIAAERNWAGTQGLLRSPVSSAEVENHVLGLAGDRLVSSTPALRMYAGWTALQPDRIQSEEVARRLALSWSSAGRRCAAGAIAACRVVLEPFDPRAGAERYFEPRDYRDVVAAGKLPALSDSGFFATRRRCLDGVDSSCVRIIAQVQPPDPFGVEIRGSLLALAIRLGGRDAVARIAAAPNDPTIPLLARAAGVSEDSLLRTWHAETVGAVANGPADAMPVLLSTVAWGALLVLAATRRKFL